MQFRRNPFRQINVLLLLDFCELLRQPLVAGFLAGANLQMKTLLSFSLFPAHFFQVPARGRQEFHCSVYSHFVRVRWTVSRLLRIGRITHCYRGNHLGNTDRHTVHALCSSVDSS